MYVKHVGLNAFINCFTVQYRVWLMILIVIQSLQTKSFFFLTLRFTMHFELSCRNLIYNHFELNSTRKVWIKWNFELTMFELTIQFNIEKIGKFDRFWKKVWIK